MLLQRYSSLALRTTLIYAVVAAAWILLSDLAINRAGEPRVIEVLSIAKGWVFVAVTAFLLFWLIRRDMARAIKAEAQLRLLFDSINDAVLVFLLKPDGTPGRFIDANDAALERLGYTCEELLQLSAWDIVKSELLPEVRSLAGSYRSSGSSVFASVHISKDGREIPVEVSSRLIRINDVAIGVNIARDTTARTQAEEQRREEACALERDKQRFYRETVLAVTGGKFELRDAEDVRETLSEPGLSIELLSGEKLADVRHAVVTYCKQQGLSDPSASDLEIAIGEALGNALKHAFGGVVEAGKSDDFVWVAVRDQGSGIDTFALPRVALMPGFSTAASMGLGYTLILELCDHVRLATGPSGTTVIMQKKLTPATEVESRMARHMGIQ